MSATLAFDAVTGKRGGRTLFEGLNFALAPGDAALVTGPNGAGKSSLVRIAGGLLAPAAGAVRREGDIALLAEAHALDPELPLARALGFWAVLDGRRGAVAGALVELGLDQIADVPVRMLSTGQRRRAAMARVAASGAPIWLLDEPANGLDAVAVGTLEALIADHRKDGGIALVATHLPIRLPDAVPVVLGSAT
ncbi:MAG: heme ABC exporter ATP-binding protein CcmA [Sphingomonas sp.]